MGQKLLISPHWSLQMKALVDIHAMKTQMYPPFIIVAWLRKSSALSEHWNLNFLFIASTGTFISKWQGAKILIKI